MDSSHVFTVFTRKREGDIVVVGHATHAISEQAATGFCSTAMSGYYAWRQQPLSNRAQENARLLSPNRSAFIASHGIYRAPRVF